MEHDRLSLVLKEIRANSAWNIFLNLCFFIVSCLSECVSVKCYSVYFVLFLLPLIKENIFDHSQKFVNCFETFPSTKSNMSSR